MKHLIPFHLNIPLWAANFILRLSFLASEMLHHCSVTTDRNYLCELYFISFSFRGTATSENATENKEMTSNSIP